MEEICPCHEVNYWSMGYHFWEFLPYMMEGLPSKGVKLVEMGRKIDAGGQANMGLTMISKYTWNHFQKLFR